MYNHNRHLFRGKRIETGEWVTGGYAEIEGYSCIILPYIEFNHENGCEGSVCIRVDPDTVSQCTGLTDKAGRLIYEGDVVRDEPGQLRVVTWDDSWLQWTADIFDADGATVDGTELGLLAKAHDINIVGNRWDNPELLEVSK